MDHDFLFCNSLDYFPSHMADLVAIQMMQDLLPKKQHFPINQIHNREKRESFEEPRTDLSWRQATGFDGPEAKWVMTNSRFSCFGSLSAWKHME